MVISDEIKFPRPIRVDPYRTEKKVDPIDGLSPVARIGAFTGHGSAAGGQAGRTAAAGRTASPRTAAGRVNLFFPRSRKPRCGGWWNRSTPT